MERGALIHRFFIQFILMTGLNWVYSLPTSGNTTSEIVTLSDRDKNSLGRETLRIIEGETLFLNCSSKSGNNMNLNDLEWRHDNTTHENYQQTFMVTKTTPLDEGVYQCFDRSGNSSNLIIEYRIQVITTGDVSNALSYPLRWEDPPRYIGIAIGLGVCLALFLLSAAAVFIHNFSSQSEMCQKTSCMRKKEPKEDNSRNNFSNHGDSKRLKMVPIPMSRMSSALERISS